MGRKRDRARTGLGKHRGRALRAKRELERYAVPSNVTVIEPNKPLQIACGLANGDDHQHDRTCLRMDGRTLDEMRAIDEAERQRDGRPPFGARLPWTTPTIEEITCSGE